MGTADPKCLLHPSAENGQPAGGAERGACLLFLWPAGQDSTLMGINEDRLKQNVLNCSSWADTVAAPGTREVTFGKAAVQLLEEITFLMTKAKSETAYLPELSATRSNILPG